MAKFEQGGSDTGATRAGIAAPDAQLKLRAASAITSMLTRDLLQPLAAALAHLHRGARQIKARGEPVENAAQIELAAKQTIKAMEIIGRMRGLATEDQLSGRHESLRLMVDRARTELILQKRLDAEVDVQIRADATYVVVDRASIEFVITNLLTNALDAMAGRTGRTIDIQSSRRGDMVELRIADSGPGLSEAVRTRLFTSQLTTKPGGSGLGLSICRAIVEAHGGKLWAAGSSRKGAEFYLTLPIARHPAG